MGSPSESEIAGLERQLKQLQEEVAAEKAATAGQAGLLRGERRRGWTAVGVLLGLLVAVALALPIEALFTTPRMDDRNCHLPVPRGEAMRQFNQGFSGLRGSGP